MNKTAKGVIYWGGYVLVPVLLAFIATLHFSPPFDVKNNETQGRMQWLAHHGDLFNGYVGPFLSFITFIGVLITINLQMEEQAAAKIREKEQSELQHRQTFEQAFFEMLDVHTSIVDSLRFTRVGVDVSGRAVFETFVNIFNNIYQIFSGSMSDDEALALADRDFYKDFRQSVGHYFRYLYNLMRFLDETEGIDHRKYSRIVRAQLSDYELVLIFYTSISERGRKMRTYVERYALLDNLDTSLLLDPGHKELLSLTAFGDHEV